jgi:hypothetical protein
MTGGSLSLLHRCDGLSPADGIRTEAQQLLSTAGELIALLEGLRGVCIVQLYNGWDPSKGQPLYDPHVIPLLERALQHPDIKASVSAAPEDVGLSLVLYADKEPYNAWGPHLCSFGCQANTVAGSTYYKLLIGRLLGYKPANIIAYAKAMGGFVTPQIERQVRVEGWHQAGGGQWALQLKPWDLLLLALALWQRKRAACPW